MLSWFKSHFLTKKQKDYSAISLEKFLVLPKPYNLIFRSKNSFKHERLLRWLLSEQAYNIKIIVGDIVQVMDCQDILENHGRKCQVEMLLSAKHDPKRILSALEMDQTVLLALDNTLPIDDAQLEYTEALDALTQLIVSMGPGCLSKKKLGGYIIFVNVLEFSSINMWCTISILRAFNSFIHISNESEELPLVNSAISQRHVFWGEYDPLNDCPNFIFHDSELGTAGSPSESSYSRNKIQKSRLDEPGVYWTNHRNGTALRFRIGS
ncbi:hypothetical protein ACI2KR_27365 [Pseudomonas luteola]